MQEDLFQLFVRHFSSETTEEEEIRLKLILEQNSDALIDFNALAETWEKSGEFKNAFDIEKGLASLKQKIKQKEKQNMLFWRIAAIFISFIFISSALYWDYNQSITFQANNGIKKIILPDSSLIYLNKNASISYATSYLWRFNRNVKLKGEAFFDIKSKECEEFIVKTNSFEIQVLGTQFNVCSNNQESTIVLKEGKVRLFNFKGEQKDIVMSPGDCISYNKKNNSLKKDVVNPDLFSIWKEKRIRFNNFNLSEVAHIINQVFGKKVNIKNKSLINKRLNGSAPIDDLDILLKALSEILGEELSIQNDTIIIK
ncbi:MAG: FecR family protein [Bacteroidales bacterium]|nr:FecR family protein [Bacteroidales bacterium]